MTVRSGLDAQEVFSFLRPEQVHALSEAAESVMYAAGQPVYHSGEPARYLYLVLDGEVMLRLPGKSGTAVPIDVVTKGAIFGSCMCFDIETYSTTAHCVRDSKLMKIEAEVFRQLLDDDPRMGYVMQRRISQIYFRRYLETMRKLQAIVMNIPLEVE